MTDLEQLAIDGRWSGAHGIGRYSSEVVPRLTIPHQLLSIGGRPSSAFDALRKFGVARAMPTYSPGYNGFLGGGSQYLTIHDLIHLTVPGVGGRKYHAYYNLVLRPIIRRSGLVFTVSEASRRQISRWLADDRVRIVNAAAGCAAAFSVDGEVRAFARPTLISVGNLRRHKNVVTFLRALAFTDFGAVVVVPHGERVPFQQLLRETDVSDRVELLSGVSDEELAANYRGAVGSVMPSLLEGFGLPALESLRCGTPVAYWSGCESVAEIVGSSGIGVESPTDPREWSKACDTLVSGIAVSQTRIEQHSWDATARIVDGALREALQNAE